MEVGQRQGNGSVSAAQHAHGTQLSSALDERDA